MKRVLHLSAKALKATLLTVVFLLLAVAIFLNSNFFDRILQDLIQTKGSQAVQREFTMDSVAFNPFKLDVRLRNFRLENDVRSPEVPFFAAEEIYARVSWRHLLAGKIRIREVRLKKPILNATFYEKQRGAGNNIPTGKKQEGEKKKGGIDFIISQVDAENMTIVMDHLRVPISFSVKELQTLEKCDDQQHNHAATTSFQDGYLKITHFDLWKFDMMANYRIIGDRVSFERLHLTSPRSKFYMAGEMYTPKKPFFDMRFRSHIDLKQTKEIFHFGMEMAGRGTFRGVYKGTFERFRMQGTGNFHNFVFYSLPIDQATFDLDMTDNWLNVSNIRSSMFDGSYDGTFAMAPLRGNAIFNATANWKNWDERKLCRFIRMSDMVLPVKGSGSAALRWAEIGLKDMTG